MKLTPVMQTCLAFCRDHDGVIYRHPGGFWSHVNWRRDGLSFGTSTVDGMVKRGALAYTEWQHGRNGRFPVRANVVSPPGNGSSGPGESV